MLGARPTLDLDHRGADHQAALGDRDRDRHPQPAAGLPGRRSCRLHVPGRPRRVRRGRSGLQRAEGKAHAGVRQRGVRLIRWRLIVIAAAVLGGIALTACESTQDKATRLQEEAIANAPKPLTTPKPNKDVKVLDTTLLHDQYGDAIAVVVKNESNQTLVNLPILWDVRNDKGKSGFRNDAPGASACGARGRPGNTSTSEEGGGRKGTRHSQQGTERPLDFPSSGRRVIPAGSADPPWPRTSATA